MKKTRILALLALILCFCLVLASCQNIPTDNGGNGDNGGDNNGDNGGNGDNAGDNNGDNGDNGETPSEEEQKQAITDFLAGWKDSDDGSAPMPEIDIEQVIATVQSVVETAQFQLSGTAQGEDIYFGYNGGYIYILPEETWGHLDLTNGFVQFEKVGGLWRPVSDISVPDDGNIEDMAPSAYAATDAAGQMMSYLGMAEQILNALSDADIPAPTVGDFTVANGEVVLASDYVNSAVCAAVFAVAEAQGADWDDATKETVATQVGQIVDMVGLQISFKLNVLTVKQIRVSVAPDMEAFADLTGADLTDVEVEALLTVDVEADGTPSALKLAVSAALPEAILEAEAGFSVSDNGARIYADVVLVNPDNEEDSVTLNAEATLTVSELGIPSGIAVSCNIDGTVEDMGEFAFSASLTFNEMGIPSALAVNMKMKSLNWTSEYEEDDSGEVIKDFAVAYTEIVELKVSADLTKISAEAGTEFATVAFSRTETDASVSIWNEETYEYEEATEEQLSNLGVDPADYESVYTVNVSALTAENGINVAVKVNDTPMANAAVTVNEDGVRVVVTIEDHTVLDVTLTVGSAEDFPTEIPEEIVAEIEKMNGASQPEPIPVAV